MTSIGKVFAYLVVIALGVIGIVSITPVTLETASKVGISELDRQEWERVPSAKYSRLTIKNLSTRPVDLPYPELRWPERFSPNLINLASGASLDGRIQRIKLDPGAFVLLEGVYGDIGLTLPGESEAEEVVAEWRSGGETLSLKLDQEQPGVLFESQSELFMRTLPFLWRGVDPADYGATGRVDVRVGSDEFQLQAGQAVGISRLLASSLKSVLGGLILLIAALVLLGVMWFLGYLIVGRPGPSWARGIDLAVGAGVVAVGANTLAYLFPIPLVAALLALSIGVFCVVRGLSLRANGALFYFGADSQAFVKALAIVLVPGILLFFPIFLSPGTFLGAFKTDLTVQASLAATFLRDLSMLEMQNSPAVQNILPEYVFTPTMGFEWRSIDTVVASLLSLGSQNTNTGWEVSAVVFYLVYGVTLLQVASYTNTGRLSKVIAALLLLFPPITTLYLENYSSQYMLAAFLPGLIWAGVNLSREVRDERVALGSVMALAILIAVSFLAYPHFTLVVVGILSLFYIGVQIGHMLENRDTEGVLSWLSVSLVSGRSLLKISLLAAIIIGPGLLLIQGLDDGGVYVSDLNQILLGVLLSPYSTLQELGLAAGTVPYIWRQFYVDPAAFMGGVGFRIWGIGLDSRGSLVPTALALGLTVIAGIWAVNWTRTRAGGRSAGIVIVILSLALVGLLMVLGGNYYGAFKIAWTAVCVVPLLVVSLSIKKGRALILAMAMIPLSLLWIRTDVVERVSWLTNPISPDLAVGHSFLQEDLREVDSSLRGIRPQSVEIIEGKQPLNGTNNELVLFYQAIRIARDQGLRCRSCVRVKIQKACPKDSDAIVTIGRVNMDEMCDLPRVYGGQTVEVFGRPSRSGAQPGE